MGSAAASEWEPQRHRPRHLSEPEGDFCSDAPTPPPPSAAAVAPYQRCSSSSYRRCSPRPRRCGCCAKWRRRRSSSSWPRAARRFGRPLVASAFLPTGLAQPRPLLCPPQRRHHPPRRRRAVPELAAPQQQRQRLLLRPAAPRGCRSASVGACGTLKGRKGRYCSPCCRARNSLKLSASLIM